MEGPDDEKANIRVFDGTRNRLRAAKEGGESYDDTLNRLLGDGGGGDGGGDGEQRTLHCECGNSTYRIKWKMDSGDTELWAECCDCGRPTATVGDGRDRQLRWMARNQR